MQRLQTRGIEIHYNPHDWVSSRKFHFNKMNSRRWHRVVYDMHLRLLFLMGLIIFILSMSKSLQAPYNANCNIYLMKNTHLYALTSKECLSSIVMPIVFRFFLFFNSGLLHFLMWDKTNILYNGHIKWIATIINRINSW